MSSCKEGSLKWGVGVGGCVERGWGGDLIAGLIANQEMELNTRVDANIDRWMNKWKNHTLIIDNLMFKLLSFSLSY